MTVIPEQPTITRQWTIHKFVDQAHYEQQRPYAIVQFEGNMLLNTGIALLEDLLIGAGGTPYAQASTYVGVGTSAATEAATQTDLMGTATYVPCEPGYPLRLGQTLTWRGVFTALLGNHAWQEFSVRNGLSPAE